MTRENTTLISLLKRRCPRQARHGMECRSSISFAESSGSHGCRHVSDVCSTQLHETYARSSRGKYVADEAESQLQRDQRRGRLCSGRALKVTLVLCTQCPCGCEVRALFLQCVILVNDTVLPPCCARDGVWPGAVRKPCTPVVCTCAFDHIQRQLMLQYCSTFHMKTPTHVRF